VCGSAELLFPPYNVAVRHVKREHQGHDDDVNKDMEVTDGNKKRKRKPYRPGEKRAGS
jgi:hypothetical protein